MDSGFRDDVRVEAVAEVDGVDVVTVVVWLASYRRGWHAEVARSCSILTSVRRIWEE
jgi:hypothetical protein